MKYIAVFDYQKSEFLKISKQIDLEEYKKKFTHMAKSKYLNKFNAYFFYNTMGEKNDGVVIIFIYDMNYVIESFVKIGYLKIFFSGDLSVLIFVKASNFFELLNENGYYEHII